MNSEPKVFLKQVRRWRWDVRIDRGVITSHGRFMTRRAAMRAIRRQLASWAEIDERRSNPGEDVTAEAYNRPAAPAEPTYAFHLENEVTPQAFADAFRKALRQGRLP